mmetsp:Transcript_41513/g.81113  ORF Transcript_41513/g.81113 Transcript_41513/m.81113 type:complete len:212 (+) Transcript_41513:279-914(+)
MHHLELIGGQRRRASPLDLELDLLEHQSPLVRSLLLVCGGSLVASSACATQVQRLILFGRSPPPDLAAGAFLTHLPASSSSSERAMRRSTTTAPPANATLPPTIAPPPLRLAIFLTAKRALSYVSVSASVVSWTLSSMNQAALEARSDRLTGLGWTFCAAWTPDADMSTEAAAARDAAFLRHALCCFSSCLPSSPPPISPTPSLPCASPPS